MRGVGEIKGLWKRGLLSSRYSPSLSSDGEITGAEEEVTISISKEEERRRLEEQCASRGCA